MKTDFTAEEIRELERQLSHPNGQAGIDIGKAMEENNAGMITSTIESLEVEDNQSVLELGHGNGYHLEHLFNLAEGINYRGLEISELMQQEAQKLDHKSNSAKTTFALYDGETIPFDDNSFDRIMTVNTVYFWAKPTALMNELSRVLKPEGSFTLTYAQKDFMKQLPFVGESFTLYDNKDIQELVALSNLKIVKFIDKSEFVKSKTGEAVERKYSMVILAKK